MQDTIYFHGSILMNNVDWCASLNCYMLRRIRDQHYIFIAWKVGRGGGGGGQGTQRENGCRLSKCHDIFRNKFASTHSPI